MSRQKVLAKNTAILTFGKICTQCVSFFLLPLYTAILNTSDYGTFDLVITYGALLFPIVGCQLDQGIFRFLVDCRNNHKEQGKLFSSILVADTIFSLVFFMVVCIAGTSGVLKHKLFLVFYVIFQVFTSLLMQFTRGLGNNKIYAVASFISASMTVVFNVLFLVIIEMGLEGLFIATISAQIITILYLCFMIKPWKYFMIQYISVNTFKSVAKYSIPLIPNELSWWVVNVSDRTIVSYVLGVSINGIYTIANKFSNLFISFYNIFNLSWTETVSLHYNDDDGNEFLSETITTMFKLFSSACFIIVVIMPFIFPWLINEKYSEAYNQIIILLYAMLLRVIVGLYSAIYVATKESKKIAYTSVTAAMINIVVNLLLINKIGLYAASLSTVVAFGVMSFVRVMDINRKSNIRIAGNVIISTIIVASLVAITYYINDMLINVFMFIGVCIYSIIINYDLLQHLFRLIRKCLVNYKNKR